MMIKSQIPMPTATPMIVWSLRTGSGVAEVRPSVPPAALAAEADALERPVIVVVLMAMMLVTTDRPGPEPEPLTAELNRVDMGVEAELNNVDTGLDDWKPTIVEELPDDAVIDAPPTDRRLLLPGTLKTSVDDEPPTGG